MVLPVLRQEQNRTQRQLVSFGGINYSESAREGELLDSQGLTSARYPYLSQRIGRGTERTYGGADDDTTWPTALHASKEALCVVHGTDFSYNGIVKGTVTAGEKQMASIGQRVVIFPDKKYYDFNLDEFGSLEETYVSGASEITFTTASIVTGGADFNFRAGDAVEITGCTVNVGNNKTLIIRSIAEDTLTFYSNSFTGGAETAAITIKRTVPDLKNIVQANNRLWGTVDQEIRGSALGDPFNWNKYDALSGDSYAVVVGTAGDFTGAALYAEHICFFKEGVIHKLYGTKPSNYQITTVSVPGVQGKRDEEGAGLYGSSKSVVTINEVLYYKSRDGIYAYTGGIPKLISSNFGVERYSEARAHTDGSKYYISMRHTTGTWGLYVYDPMTGLWLHEDDTHVIDFGELDGTIYYIEDGAQTVRSMNIAESEERVSWLAELVPFTETIHERKCYSKLSVRLDLDAGSWIDIEVKTDRGRWNKVFSWHNENPGTVTVPIIPTRCDNFSVRFLGEGGFMLKSFVRELTVGSEV